MPPRAYRLVFGVSIFFIAFAAVAASAAVRDARVAKGAATIFGQGTGAVTIYQSTDRAVIDWRDFKIAGDETLRLVQPNASSVTLIRVAGGVAAAQIDGAIDATGGVFIVDRKGVFLGRSARIRAGGFLATTHDAADRDFMSGRNNFAVSGEPSASIVNLGTISASPGGYVALVAAGVRNDGTIAAERGSIAAAAATRFELDVGGRSLVELSSDDRIANDAVDPDRPPLAIKVSGRITALGTSDGAGGGKIRISGEDVALAGATIDASAQAAGDGGEIIIRGSRGSRIDRSLILADGAPAGRGGFIETSGRSLALSHSSIGAQGSGRWLLDPYDLTVDRSAARVIAAALAAGTGVTLQTTAAGKIGPGKPNRSGNGDILIDSPISWGSAAILTLSAYRNIAVNADVTVAGGGGLALTTGTGTAGDYSIAPGSSISFTQGSSSGAALSINGAKYALLDNVAAVRSINASGAALGGNYALAKSLHASNTENWKPLGTDGAGNVKNSGKGFTGVFTGLGNSISSLTVNLPSANYVGLFGYSSGTIRDIGIIASSVTGGDFVGTLAGYNNGTVSTAYAFNADSAAAGVIGVDAVGGLVGHNQGAISASYAAVVVTDNAAGTDVGGLVGRSIGTIDQCYATGAVLNSSGTDVGGLAGYNGGQMTDSYATGMARAPSFTASGKNIAGLVGYNAGALTRTYAKGFVGAAAEGSVPAGIDLGGLVGNNQGTIVDGYWDIDTTGLEVGVGPDSASGGATGLSARSGPSPFRAASYAGFDFGKGAAWNILAGISHPYLQLQFPDGAPQVISGTGLRAPLISSTANGGVPGLYGYTVAALVNGVSLGVVSTTGLNGYYELLVPPGTIPANGRKVLVSLIGYPTGNSFFDGATGSITGLDIFGHFLTVYSGAGTVTEIAADLAVALGSHSGDVFIFTLGPPPSYKLALVPDPLGLPRGSQFMIVSSAANLVLDQIPAFPSTISYTMIMMTRDGAAVRQTAPILGGGRLSLIGKEASFALTDPANEISLFAAGLYKSSEVRLTDKAALTIGSVNTIQGVDTTTLVVNDAAGVKQSEPITAKSVLLRGRVFSLINPRNKIGVLAANAQTVKVNDGRSLATGAVAGLDGVTADVVELSADGNLAIRSDGPLSGRIVTLDTRAEAREDPAGRIDAKLLNVTAATGISLGGNNNIVVVGTAHTDSGPNRIKQH